MGDRLYNPTAGRFLSADPVAGGNENAYNYPNDPVNSSDPSGNCICQGEDLRSLFYEMSAYWHTYCQTGCWNVIHLGKVYPKVRIPLPSRKSQTAIKHKDTVYYVYEIWYYTKFGTATYKYGITRVGPSRPKRQIPKCMQWSGANCGWDWVATAIGYIAARTWEASFMWEYALRHDGFCPPGNPGCI
jgi:hypothetical protein